MRAVLAVRGPLLGELLQVAAHLAGHIVPQEGGVVQPTALDDRLRVAAKLARTEAVVVLHLFWLNVRLFVCWGKGTGDTPSREPDSSRTTKKEARIRECEHGTKRNGTGEGEP